MTVEKFGGAVADDVGSPFDRPAEVGRGQGVVDHQRQLVGLGNGGDLSKGENNQTGVPQGLTINEPGGGPDCTKKGVRIGGIGKGDLDPQPWQGIAQLGVGTAIQTVAGNDMVARATEREEGQGLSAMTAAGRQSGNTTFQIGDPLFEYISGRIHDPRINIAEFFEGKEIGGMLGIFKEVGGRLVQG